VKPKYIDSIKEEIAKKHKIDFNSELKFKLGLNIKFDNNFRLSIFPLSKSETINDSILYNKRTFWGEKMETIDYTMYKTTLTYHIKFDEYEFEITEEEFNRFIDLYIENKEKYKEERILTFIDNQINQQ
jgi:hypothetical protein